MVTGCKRHLTSHPRAYYSRSSSKNSVIQSRRCVAFKCPFYNNAERFCQLKVDIRANVCVAAHFPYNAIKCYARLYPKYIRPDKRLVEPVFHKIVTFKWSGHRENDTQSFIRQTIVKCAMVIEYTVYLHSYQALRQPINQHCCMSMTSLQTNASFFAVNPFIPVHKSSASTVKYLIAETWL